MALNAPCSFDGCSTPWKSKGLCHSHADQRRKGKPLTPLLPYSPRRPIVPGESCAVEFCSRQATRQGFCPGHYAASRRGQPFNRLDLTDEERFFARVSELAGGCWLWTGEVGAQGYGRFGIGARTKVPAHRWAYEFMRGQIPEGLEIDHLCRNRACVNPWHLEPVTHRVNSLRGVAPAAVNARKTHCHKGHEFTPENTVHRSNGGRRCRACMKAYNAAASMRRVG